MLSIVSKSHRVLKFRPVTFLATNRLQSSVTQSDNDAAQPTLMERNDKGFLKRLQDKYSFQKQTDRILVAESYLQAATTQASDKRWFVEGRINDDFRSYQALLTMHVWFLHKRLIADNQDPHTAALIQEELFDILWTDSTNRMRAHGVNEFLMTKNLKAVQQYTFMHCFHYDHCYTDLLDKPKERLEELKNLVQTHILLVNPEDHLAIENSMDQAERIAWYIESQYINIIHDLPDELYRKARIAWVDLPDFSDLKDAKGKILEPIMESDKAKESIPKFWVKTIANDGTYFYWNTETRESQWENPTLDNK